MKKHFCIPLLFCFLMAIAGCKPAADSKASQEADKAAIEKLISEHMDAFWAKDLQKSVAMWTDDMSEMNPGMPPIIGKASYTEYCRKASEGMSGIKSHDFQYPARDFIIAGDWAMRIGTYTASFVLPNDSVIRDEGNYCWIFKRDETGSWRWARSITNNYPPGLK